MKNDETIGIFPIKNFFHCEKMTKFTRIVQKHVENGYDFYRRITYESATLKLHFNLCSLSLEYNFRSYILVLETPIKIFEDSKMIFNAQADTSRDEKVDASTYY